MRSDHPAVKSSRRPAPRPRAAIPSQLLRTACAQAARVLAVPVAPGTHPLRALRCADGAAPLLAPEWAEINGAADPVFARMMVFNVLGTGWQWTALPADYAREVAAADLLRPSTRVLALGGAYVETLQGRCAEPGVALRPAPRSVSHRRRVSLSSRRAAARRPEAFWTRRCWDTVWEHDPPSRLQLSSPVACRLH